MTKQNPKLLSPPWRERREDGTLGEWYGPATLQTYAKQIAAHRDWSYRVPSKEARRSEALIAWMRLEDGTLRPDVPAAEVRTFLLIEQGHSIRFAARKLGVSRESVRSYLRRLRARMAE